MIVMKDSTLTHKSDLLTIFSVLMLLVVSLGSAVPVIADPGNGVDNDWVCVILDQGDDEFDDPGDGEFVFSCENEGDVVTCWVTGEVVGCDPQTVDCEAYLFPRVEESGTDAYFRCGAPLHIECVAMDGELSCDGIPSFIETDNPNAFASAASFPGASCTGVWGSQTQNSAGSGEGEVIDQALRGMVGNYDGHDEFGIMQVVESGETDVHAAESEAYLLANGVSTLVPNPTMPGVMGEALPDDSGKAGIAVSLFIFLASLALDNWPSPSGITLPTRSWYVVCWGEVDMGGECRGGVLVEERECVLVVVDPTTGDTEDIPGSHCKFRYLPEFPLTCWSSMEGGASAQPRGSNYSGTFSNSNRDLPMEAEVCWNRPVNILNRPYGDEYGAWATIEQAAGIGRPRDGFTQLMVGDCHDVDIDWNLLTWSSVKTSCNTSNIIGPYCWDEGYSYWYDPVSGAWDEQLYCSTKFTMPGGCSD